ncbi:MAG: DMT family transporter, partial [Candidatus Zixiibacteriota bacterium]
MSEFFAGNYGEIFALLAALMWASASMAFTAASREVGAGNLNRLRLVFATFILAVIVTFTTGWDWADTIGRREFWLLALSGLIGLAFGDRFYFAALREMGPRLTTQVFALNPVTSVVLAWILLGENLGAGSIVGIVVTIGGVLVVTSERRRSFRHTHTTPRGLFFAAIATVCHSGAFVLAKHVMADRIDSLTGSFIRMIAAMSAVWILAAFRGNAVTTLKSLSTGRRWRLVLTGALLGPTIGVWLALISINHAPIGI